MGDWGMAQWTKRLLYQYEAPSLDPQNPHKTWDMISGTCYHSGKEGERQADPSSSLARQFSQISEPQANERPHFPK